jgi:hypothetical protein
VPAEAIVHSAGVDRPSIAGGGTEMKAPLAILAVALCSLPVPAGRAAQRPLTIKGFHLGMNREAARRVYQGFVHAKVAQRVSIESETYRDLITLDNATSSMGNKIELAYDENGILTGVTFQHATVDILFHAGAESAENFVKRFCGEHGLAGMEREDQGFVTLWTFTDQTAGYKVSIDDSKNLRMQRL